MDFVSILHKNLTKFQDIDVLVRTEQLFAILDDFLSRDRWKEVQPSEDSQRFAFHEDIHRVGRVAEGTNDEYDLCLSFWTEQKYRVNVDGAKVEVPDA